VFGCLAFDLIYRILLANFKTEQIIMQISQQWRYKKALS